MATHSHLPSTIRSALLYNAGDIRIEQVSHPPLLPGHVAITPKFCGICGSDLHFFLEQTFADTLKVPHPITGSTLPAHLGHEFSGAVAKLGDGCKGDLKVGDNVAVMPLIYDGTCSSCVAGAMNTCTQAGFYGIHSKTGGLSDGAVIPEELVFKLPEAIDLDIGALIEPLAVAWHAISLVPDKLSNSTTALIIGAGPIGAAVLIGLRAKGVTRVAVSEPSPDRRRFISDIGAAVTFDPLSDNLPVEIRSRLERPDGADLVIDCAGIGPTMETALACTRPRGTIVNVFVTTAATTFHSFFMQLKEITVRGSMGYNRQDFLDVIEAIDSGRMDPRPLITKRIKLEDVVEEGIASLGHKDNKNCKILVDLSL